MSDNRSKTTLMTDDQAQTASREDIRRHYRVGGLLMCILFVAMGVLLVAMFVGF